MNGRWRSVREQLVRGVSVPAQDDDGWDQVSANRTAGRSVTLPVRDPRARPGVVVGLLGAGAIAFGFMQMRQPMARLEAAQAQSDAGGWNWFVPPAYAQEAATSSLPRVDPLNLTHIRPGRWVYTRHSGVDGVVTSGTSFDTLRIARDTAIHAALLIVVLVQPRNRVVDSLVIVGKEGTSFRKVAWKGFRDDTTRFARLETTVRPDTILFNVYPRNGGPSMLHPVSASYSVAVEALLPALLPGVAMNDGYARSLNALDLLGGETRTAGRPYELRVTGRESVRTLAGSFDCWLVELKTRDLDWVRTHQLKVDRSSGTLIQARWDDKNGFFSEQELVAYD